MTYDPNFAGQYDYYQDPSQEPLEYGWAYGYGNEQPYEPSPPPAPDKDWVDPVVSNREYLKKIQKSCVHKGFEGLREDGLFLFEVTARYISLNKDIFENLGLTEKKDKPFMTFVKILDTHFVEVNEAKKSGNRASGEYRTTSVLSYRKSFTHLFQSIYSSTGEHDSLIPEVKSDKEKGGGEKRSDSKNAEIASVILKTEEPNENIDENIEEIEKVEIMKGKSVLLPLPGLTMIQKMQQHPLIFKVTRCDVTDDDFVVEGENIATAVIRLPETFRKAVLMSCKAETVLPLVAVTTGGHTLTDRQGGEVGQAELTLVLTCFGKGAVNCVTETEDSHEYEHTFLLRHLKAKHVVSGEENMAPAVDPRFAKHVINLGLFLPNEKTSSEILQHCLSSNLIPDEEDRKCAQIKRNCNWYHLVKKARPSSTNSFDFDEYIKEMKMERVTLWRKHKKICRDLKSNEKLSVSRRSLEERFKEVQIVETGVTDVETQNPFEDIARHSVNVLCAKSFTSNLSETESFKK